MSRWTDPLGEKKLELELIIPSVSRILSSTHILVTLPTRAYLIPTHQKNIQELLNKINAKPMKMFPLDHSLISIYPSVRPSDPAL